MEVSNWMTIIEMSKTSRLVSMWRILQTRKPRNIYEKLDIDTEEMTIRINDPRIQFTEQSFRLKASRDWNELPEYLRKKNISSFKKQLKEWILSERTQIEPY